MKKMKLFFAFIILATSLSFLYADWDFVAGGYISEIEFVGNDGWAVLSEGLVIHTPDGGTTWEYQETDTTERLYGVSFVSNLEGWVTGNDGLIFHTTDGGNTWTAQNSTTTTNLQSICFVDALNGWAAGSYGTVLHTSDGGVTWSAQTSSISSKIYSIFFIDALNGWAVAASDYIIHTTDGGATWVTQTNPTTDSMKDVIFYDVNEGWAAGQHSILHTVDGGTTWVEQTNPGDENLYGIGMGDNNHLWVVGIDGEILTTTNGGTTWIEQSFSLDWLLGAYFEDDLTGWIVGSGGAIYKTTDGGSNWIAQQAGTSSGLRRTVFVDDNNVWGCGTKGFIIHSGDGGLTWESKDSGFDDWIWDITFASDLLHGWAAGDDQTTGETPILATVDGGETWVQHLTGIYVDVVGIEAVSNTEVFAAAKDGIILHTTDGGTTWNQQTSGVTVDFKSIEMVSEDIGWIVGSDGTIVYTNDGGTTWTQQTSGTTETLYDVSFVDFQNGWVVGNSGTILNTIDGGTTWSFQPSGTGDGFRRVSTIDLNEVWAIAGEGFHTTDGGLTWTAVPIPCSIGLWGVDFANSNLGIAMGNGGIITRFTSEELNPPQNLFVDDTGYATWDPPGGIGSILVVDRDGSYDSYTDCWPAYQAALDANGYTYTYYEVLDLAGDGPDLATMQLHDCIIWFSGEAWGYYGDDCMTPTDEANLGVFLDDGGSLFFAGQDYLWASYPAAGALSSGQFPYDYLGISNVSQDVWFIATPSVGTAEGATGSIAEGFSFTIEDIFTTDREGLYIDQIISHNGLGLFNITSPAPVGVAAVQYDASTFRTIFSTMAFAAITDPTIQADLMANIVAYLSGGDEERDLLGYNVYLDGVPQTFTTDEFYQYTGLVNGTTYLAEVTALYDEGESDPIDYQFTYVGGTTLLPPEDVSVDPNSWLLTWFPPGGVVSSDDFESYVVGEYLAVQSDLWTTWTNSPGSAEDAYISDVQALSGTQSVIVEGSSDLVYIMNDYTSGVYSMEVNLFIPTGYCGYWNLQKTSTPGQEWAFQIMFDVTGIASADAGASAAFTFPFSFDTWINMELVVDLNADWCEIWVDGVMLYEYQWTLGTFGTPGLLQFGGMNLYAWASTGNSPMCYFDDITLSVIEPADGIRETRDLIGFNVYLDDMVNPIATVGIDVYEYQYTGLVIGNIYIAGVSALYDEGESEIVEYEFEALGDIILPPENLTAEIVTFNDVLLNWEAPGGITGEWIGWDNGTNGNSIGLTSGGEFYVASRWDPAALAPYDGYELTKIMFFPASDVPTTYELMVWTGVNASTLVLTQPVTTFVYNDFNEIDLDTPIIINASDELWFGYATNHVAGEHPAGTDPGPAVAGYGDMITMDGGATWDPLSGFGLDYNWNLQGYVMGSDGEKIAMTPPQRTRKVTPVRFNSNVQLSVAHNAIRRTNTAATDDLRLHLGYNVYKDGVEIEYISGPEILTYTDLGVEPGVREYYVTAVYDEGESVPSNTESVEIILPIPQNPEANFTYPNVLVTWDPISDGRNFASYSVYRDADPTAIATGITSTMYVDSGLPNGFYFYNVTAVYDGDYESDWSEDSNIVEVVESGNILIPVRTELTGNYPNPFNPETTIQFSLKEDSDVSIKIYNIKGAVVRTLVDGEMKASYHKIIWDSKDNTGKQVGSGLYFYKMISEGNSGDYTSTKKMILLK